MSKGSSWFEREFLRLIHLRVRSVDKRLNMSTRFGFQVEGGAGHTASLAVKQVSNMIGMGLTMEHQLTWWSERWGTPRRLSSQEHG